MGTRRSCGQRTRPFGSLIADGAGLEPARPNGRCHVLRTGSRVCIDDQRGGEPESLRCSTIELRRCNRQGAPVGLEPTTTGLQPVAWPSGSSVIKVSRPGIEPDLRASRARVLAPAHSQDKLVLQYLARLTWRSLAGRPPLRRASSWQGMLSALALWAKEPTTGFAPVSTALRERSLSQSSHVGNRG